MNADESPPSSLCSSRSCTPVYDEEEERRKNIKREKEAYEALIADGGQPSHRFSLDFDLRNPGQYKDILRFWHSNAGGFGFEQEFQLQLIRWKKFREFQDRMRKSYVPQNRFHRYENFVRESWEDAQCKWEIRVHEDRHKQNRLEDWNEFRSFYYHNRLRPHRRRVPPVEKKFYDYWKQLEDIEPGLGGFPPAPDDPPGKTIMDGERRSEDAQGRIEAAERKLQQARSECPEGQGVLMAEKELELAQEISRLQHCIRIARGNFRGGLKDVKMWEVFVKWIDDQYASIAAECGYTTDDSVRIPKLTSSGRRKKDQKPRSPLSPVRSAVSKRPRRERESPRSQGFKAQVEETTAASNGPRRSQREMPAVSDKLVKSARRGKKSTPLGPFCPRKVTKPAKKVRPLKGEQSVKVGVELKRLSTSRSRHRDTIESTPEVVTTRYGRKIKQPEKIRLWP